MGISGLWNFLRDQGHVRNLDGVELARHVENKVLAVDASLWLMQCRKESTYLHDKKHIKVMFERVIHYLRLGALPVLVFEGYTPPAKQTKMERRRKTMWKGMSSPSQPYVPRCNHSLMQLGEDVKKLLDAMGLPYEQAGGEGEALCAVMYCQGLVDSVVSSDGDALLYGARRLYKDLRLHARLLPDNHSGEWVALENDDGVSISGQDLMAVCLLAGCDFLSERLRQVGCKGAWGVVRALKARRARILQQGEGSAANIALGSTSLVDLLRSCLSEAVDEPMTAPAAGACVTCRSHPHVEAGKKVRGTKGCQKCGMLPKVRGGVGEGGCNRGQTQADAVGVGGVFVGNDSPCLCMSCQRRDDGTLQLLAKRARDGQGGLQGYLRKFDEARAAYKAASDAAMDLTRSLRSAGDEATGMDGSAPGKCPAHFEWRRRPDVALLKEMLEPVYGKGGMGGRNLARKLLPLLLEWDARHIGDVLGPGPDAQEVGARELALETHQGYLFAPIRIDRVCQIGGGGWRYAMDWVALRPEAESLIAEAAEGMQRAADSQWTSQGGGKMLPSLKEVLSEGRGSLRRSLVEAKYPYLMRAFEQRCQRIRPSRPRKEQGRDALSSAIRPEGRLEHFFSPLKAALIPPSSPSQPPGVQSSESPSKSSPRVTPTLSYTDFHVESPVSAPSPTVRLGTRSSHSCCVPRAPRKGKPPDLLDKGIERQGLGGRSARRNLDHFFKRARFDDHPDPSDSSVHGAPRQIHVDIRCVDEEETDGEDLLIDLTADPLPHFSEVAEFATTEEDWAVLNITGTDENIVDVSKERRMRRVDC